MVKFGFKSDKGKVRANNQDSCFVMPEEGIFLVADGVGGHTGGEIASRTAMTDIAAFIRENPIPAESEERLIREYFRTLAELVNEHIMTIAEQKQTGGMATTLVAMYLCGNRAIVMNVGDSRAYLIHKDTIRQITEDHTFVNDLVKKGILSQEEAEHHPDRNMITRAIGAERKVKPDFYVFDVQENDVVLLCTDGLYNELSSEQLLEHVKREPDMRRLSNRLVDEANNRGGMDNITVVSVKI